MTYNLLNNIYFFVPVDVPVMSFFGDIVGRRVAVF
jgi:hypothetical protein